ncbi:MAG TPA: hypothetical protein VGF40_19765 [Thermoanaerobaculia bacterium]
MNGSTSLLLAALVVASCPSPIRTPDWELLGAARAALDQLDPKREVVVVLPDDAPPDLRRVVAELRSTRLRREVIETETESFPARHLLLDRLEVHGDRASVSALLGPVPKAKEGEILLACGTRYSFTMRREGSAWKVGMMSVAIC